MVDKLVERLEEKAAFLNADCDCGRCQQCVDGLLLCEAAKALRLSTPANGEQVERDTVAFVQYWLMNADYDPTQFDKDFAAAIDARCATPTEDARSRVKVLEEALEAAAKVLAHHGIAPQVFRQVEAALGNKETDRHG